jgi:hypothetical protein
MTLKHHRYFQRIIKIFSQLDLRVYDYWALVAHAVILATQEAEVRRIAV